MQSLIGKIDAVFLIGLAACGQPTLPPPALTPKAPPVIPIPPVLPTPTVLPTRPDLPTPPILPTPPAESSALTTVQLLDQLVSLGETGPMTFDKMTVALGASPAIVETTEYRVMSRTGKTPAFLDAHLMEVKDISKNALQLELYPLPCIRFEDIKTRLGFQHNVPVHPGHPEPFLEYRSNTQPWGQLQFGYDRATECVADATLRWPKKAE